MRELRPQRQKYWGKKASCNDGKVEGKQSCSGKEEEVEETRSGFPKIRVCLEFPLIAAVRRVKKR